MDVRLNASDFYTLYRPSKCRLRVFLRHNGEKESPPGPYEEVLRRLGNRHEQTHLVSLGAYEDLSSVPMEDRAHKTREKVEEGAPVIYHGLLKSETTLDGIACEIVCEPDFLIAGGDGYIIRDSKMSRRVNDKDHPEILRQLGLYGWLYEQTFGQAPSALQVHTGMNEVVDLKYDGGGVALRLLGDIARLKQTEREPYSPVGWTKCGGCPFYHRCWHRAEEQNDVALIDGVDQGLALALREHGAGTLDEFLTQFDQASLAKFNRPWGQGMQRVGRKSEAIIRSAQALFTGKEQVLQSPELPASANYVMFDIEGLPPHLRELEKIYLWGLQVFGESGGDFKGATAGFGKDGDRDGWEQFLSLAKEIFTRYGDIPFVHWHHYERVHIDMYVERYGDRDGIAARIRNNLLDLLPVTRRSVVLPLPSYSLKVIENYVGFKRTQEEYGGDWAMAKYIEATETEDEKLRAEVVEQILVYNEEDLQATWAVLQWLRGKRV